MLEIALKITRYSHLIGPFIEFNFRMICPLNVQLYICDVISSQLDLFLRALKFCLPKKKKYF